MKKLLLFIAILFFTGRITAQVNHEVSGIVKDSTDNTVIGAWVTLTSVKDTLKTSTNPDGIFIFHNVQAGQFTITVKSLGFVNYNKRFLYNDATKRLVLDPIILKPQSNMLNEVKIDGTPSIVYKEDTVEYRASDYKVRENATVDELLKKMEGVEVATDGSVTAQGQQVVKARLNGKDYSGGDVATAIQNLPADIVEKIQIVDDYGDQAARTGIKDGDPQKILNIVTKANKSVGNMGRLTAGAGNNERYEGRVFGQRINGNQQLGVRIGLNNTVNGVSGGSSSFSGTTGGGNNGGGGNRGGGSGSGGTSGTASGGSSGGSGGTTQVGSGAISYRDQWSKKVSFNGSLSYNFNNTNSFNSSNSVSYNGGTLNSSNESESDRNTKGNALNFDLEYDIDSANFLRVQPNVSFSSSLNSSSYDYLQTGINNQRSVGGTSSENKTPNFGGSLLYQHLFKKKGTNFSLNVNYSQGEQSIENEQSANLFYASGALNNIDDVADSLVRRMVLRKTLNNTLRASATFSERLGTKSRLDFNAQTNRRAYDNSAFTNNVTPAGDLMRVDSLTNLYNYSFTETRLSVNYRFTEKKYNFSLGLTGIPTLLKGTKVHLDTSSRRTNFFIIPIARFEYQFSKQHRFSINYSGNASEPTFDQIQPVKDVSRANNPVVGNPDLKAAFNHSINTAYNNYISNSRLNYSLNLNARFVDNSVISNTIQIYERVRTSSGDTATNLINETHYLNMNGAYSYSGNYNISKSFADRKYSLMLNGSINNRHSVSMNNSIRYSTDSWSFSQRFGPRINPKEWLELNPNVSFTYTKAEFTQPSAKDSWTRNWAFTGDGKIYLQKTLAFTFSASKNLVQGINANVTTNPFIINSSIEKQFFKRRNGALGLQCFDVLKQNNFINRTINDTGGYTDTKSNALSRYFMLNFRWTPQKWTGAAPNRNGRQLMRRGDGSFF